LGLLPEVAWAELDEGGADGPGQAHVWLGPRLRLRVRMTHADDAVARAMVEGLLILVRGVYTKELELERLRAEACTDPLTGLWNRRGFDPFLEQALARSHRTGEQIAVMLCDVDRFKDVNDSLGHDAGDRALEAVASVVQQITRPTDMAARLGGDEIAILLAGSDALGASIVAERLRSALADANPLTRPLTMSIGVADTSDLISGARAPAASVQLLRLADRALYRAKSLGRDRVECFDDSGVPDALEDETTETITLRSA
jgi:diguanylate cyclase (GGDEF)-like protein